MLRPRLANVSLHHCKDRPGRYVPIRQGRKQPTYRIVSPSRRSTLSPLLHLSTSPQKPSRLFPSCLLPPIGLAFIQRRPTTRNSIHSSRNRGRGHGRKLPSSVSLLFTALRHFSTAKNVTFGPNQTVIDRPFPLQANSPITQKLISSFFRVKGIPTGQMIRIFLCSPLAASD